MAVLHPSEEKIIKYIRGRLGAPGAEPVVRFEAHLLACDHCILRAERAIEFGQALRIAVSALEGETEAT